MITLARQDLSHHQSGVSWPHWAREHGPVDRLVYLSGPEVNGWATPRHIGGVFTTRAADVMGLRSWDDAREGVASGDPWVIFDIEKAVRMLLRQSPLAYRLFASHVCLHEVLPLDRLFVLNAAVCAKMVRNIALEAQNAASRTNRMDALLAQLANLTSAWALARGQADLHAQTILPTHPEWGKLDLNDVDALKFAVKRFAEELLVSEVALPESPADYDGLSRWLVQRRIQTLT